MAKLTCHAVRSDWQGFEGYGDPNEVFIVCEGPENPSREYTTKELIVENFNRLNSIEEKLDELCQDWETFRGDYGWDVEWDFVTKDTCASKELTKLSGASVGWKAQWMQRPAILLAIERRGYSDQTQLGALAGPTVNSLGILYPSFFCQAKFRSNQSEFAGAL